MDMKETKEALLALVMIGKFVTDRLKDGAQFEDAVALGQALMMDGEFKDVVMAGYKDVEKLSEELKDLDLAKIFAVAQILPEILMVLRK